MMVDIAVSSVGQISVGKFEITITVNAYTALYRFYFIVYL